MKRLSLFILFGSSFALAAADAGSEIMKQAKDGIVAVANANGDSAKIVEVKKLKENLEIEKDRVRKDLEQAREAKATDEKITQLDDRDTEVLKIWIALETVFDDVLTPAFGKNAEFKRKACESWPREVKFQEMGGMPDGAEIPATTSLALELVRAICGSNSTAQSQPVGPDSGKSK